MYKLTTTVQSYCQGIRGFKELTQGDTDLVDILEKEVGMKCSPIGFARAREIILLDQFDYESLNTLVETHDSISSKGVVEPNRLTKNILLGLCEKVIRNFVPENSVMGVCSHYSDTISLNGKELGMEMIRTEIMDKKNSNTVRYCMSL